MSLDFKVRKEKRAVKVIRVSLFKRLLLTRNQLCVFLEFPSSYPFVCLLGLRGAQGMFWCILGIFVISLSAQHLCDY